MLFKNIYHPVRARGYRWACLQLAVSLPMFGITSSLGRPADSGPRSLRGPGVSNHPVSIVPSAGVTIPPGWPLDTDGSITCVTCHHSLPQRGESGSARLRGVNDENPDSKAFCMNCHQQRPGGGVATVHWMALSRAHILRKPFENYTARGGSIDGDSRDCLSCHDGLNASDAGHETGLDRNSGYLGDESRNHPIGLPYPLSGRRRAEVPLRPVMALPETVQLPGGMVSCVSCHDLYQPDKYRLSVPIDGSRLCLTCHEMD